MHGFTAYKAPHDPIRGEELTALVHTETQELLNSLYETADEQNPMAHSAHFSSMEGGKEDPQPQQGAGVFGTVYNAVCFAFVFVMIIAILPLIFGTYYHSSLTSSKGMNF